MSVDQLHKELEAEGFSEQDSTFKGMLWALDKFKEYSQLLDAIPDRHEAGIAGLKWNDNVKHPMALLYATDKLLEGLRGFHAALLLHCMDRYSIPQQSTGDLH